MHSISFSLPCETCRGFSKATFPYLYSPILCSRRGMMFVVFRNTGGMKSYIITPGYLQSLWWRKLDTAFQYESGPAQCNIWQLNCTLHSKAYIEEITFCWWVGNDMLHYIDVIMTTVASRITSLAVVYSIIYQTQMKKNIKALRHWSLCGEFTGTGEFPAQRASNAENVSIWWSHHALLPCQVTSVETPARLAIRSWPSLLLCW